MVVVMAYRVLFLEWSILQPGEDEDQEVGLKSKEMKVRCCRIK